MKWSSVHVLLIVLIVTLFDYRFKAESEINHLNHYVTPSGIIGPGCVNNQVPCQTIEQYATQPEIYFANNTCFYFQPGNHQLNSSLKLTHLQNISFKGLPSNNVVNLFLNSFVNITWRNCCLVQLTSINFILPAIYTFGIVFKQTQLIQLFNISVTANGHNTGCGAILSQQSQMSIRDCRFIGIKGLFGAAMMISESFAVTTGNNMFADCVASVGGSVYLSNSTLTLNGTNVFVNNTATTSVIYGFLKTHNGLCSHTANYPTETQLYMTNADGGAIRCGNCTLKISQYSTFKRNTAEDGGAVAGLHGRISIHDSILFDGNSADVGGAMYLEDINLRLRDSVPPTHVNPCVRNCTRPLIIFAPRVSCDLSRARSCSRCAMCSADHEDRRPTAG